MSRRDKTPSKAQAKYLAGIWSTGRTVDIGGRIDPTTSVCVKNRWLIPNGNRGTFPNGSPFESHALSLSGLDAIEGFLRADRMRKYLA